VGRLQKIEGVINDTVSTYAHVKLFPRGLLLFADPQLRGTIRFGKRTGNTVSVLNPDNTFIFETPPQQLDTSIAITITSQWMTEGVIVSVGPGKELHQVNDVVDNVLLLDKPITQNYSTSDRLLLHAYPMLLGADAAAGATVITVKSHYKLANGDVLTYFNTDGLLQSLSETKIVLAQRIGSTTDPFFTELYILTLAEPIHRPLISNFKCYVRAYPAYFSTVFRVPNAVFTAEPQGPFLVDLLSGNLLEGQSFNQTLSLKALSRSGLYVIGTSSDYLVIDNNYLIFRRPLMAQFPMFWDLAEGTMRLTPGRVIFKVNSLHQFCVGFRCVPPIQPPGKWRISLRSTEDSTIRFIFHPNPPQEFTLNSGANTVILVDFPVGYEPATSLEINAISETVCEIAVSDWTPVIDTVEQLEYSLVVEATGEATYQTTGLSIKPYFIGPEFLHSSWDDGTNFDSGKVFF